MKHFSGHPVSEVVCLAILQGLCLTEVIPGAWLHTKKEARTSDHLIVFHENCYILSHRKSISLPNSLSGLSLSRENSL